MYSENYDSDDTPCYKCGAPAPSVIGPPGPICSKCSRTKIEPETIKNITPYLVSLELDEFFRENKAKYNNWLGVQQIGFGRRYKDRGNAKFPSESYPEIKKALQSLYKEFEEEWFHKPTTLYIQYLEEGQYVKPHRDPVTDLYGTTIGWFSSSGWMNSKKHGGELIVEGEKILSSHGDFIHLRCQTPGSTIRGPVHSTSPVLKGRRYSIIFNYNQ